jgi:hypothetical protein
MQKSRVCRRPDRHPDDINVGRAGQANIHVGRGYRNQESASSPTGTQNVLTAFRVVIGLLSRTKAVQIKHSRKEASFECS